MARQGKGKGRGWFGNSAGHSAAGKKGGRARAKNRKSNAGMQNDSNMLEEDFSPVVGRSE